MTALDAAHAEMEAAPEDDARRLAFYQRFAETEVFLILQDEPQGDALAPRVFALDDGPLVAVFDGEDRLAEFAGGEAAYAALPGRRLVRMLAGQGLSLGLNLGVAPSAFVMPPDAIDWLAETLGQGPLAAEAAIAELSAPTGLPAEVVMALDRKLARAGGLADCAYLAGVRYRDGRLGHILALIDAREAAREALAAELAEALTFSGVEAGELDVAFFAASAPVSARLARVALRFDLGPQDAAMPAAPAPPGSDPDKPPRLR